MRISNRTSIDVMMNLIVSISATGSASLLHHNVAHAVEDVNVDTQNIQPMMGEQKTIHFSQMIASSSNGIVTVDDSGSVTISSGIPSSKRIDSSQSFGVINVVGEEGQHVVVSLSTSSLTMKHFDGIDHLNVNLEMLNDATVLKNGKASFNLGGVLSINDYQTPGIYAGSYTAMINYC